MTSDSQDEQGFAVQLMADLTVEDVRHVLAVFQSDLQRLADLLAVNVQAGDAAGFRKAAHALAGAAGAMGAAELDAACRTAMNGTTIPLAILNADIVAGVIAAGQQAAALQVQLEPSRG